MTALRCRTGLLSVLLLAAGPGSVWACNTPVFRYALQKWEAEPYQIVVFQRDAQGSSSVASKALEKSEANALVTDVNVNNPIPEVYADAWKACKDKTLPWMVGYLPAKDGVSAEPFISLPCTAENVQRVFGSPLRQKLAQRMAAGDAGVWLLLECGDKKLDDEKAALLEKTSKKLSEDVTKILRDRAREAADGSAPADDIPDRASVSVLRLPSSEADEAALVGMLRKQGVDTPTQPRAFLVFGRGRVLGSMAGDEISEENILSAVQFLAAPCMCEIKEQSPGVDLLMDADWMDVLTQVQSIKPEPQPEPNAAPPTAPAPTEKAPVYAPPPLAPQTEKFTPTPVAASTPAPEVSAQVNSNFYTARTLTLAGALLLTGFGLMWWALRRRA